MYEYVYIYIYIYTHTLLLHAALSVYKQLNQTYAQKKKLVAVLKGLLRIFDQARSRAPEILVEKQPAYEKTGSTTQARSYSQEQTPPRMRTSPQEEVAPQPAARFGDAGVDSGSASLDQARDPVWASHPDWQSKRAVESDKRKKDRDEWRKRCVLITSIHAHMCT
jgi:hypothetical protein